MRGNLTKAGDNRAMLDALRMEAVLAKDAVLMLVVMGSANLSHQDGVRPTTAHTSGYPIRQHPSG
jgi:hypothetical protein